MRTRPRSLTPTEPFGCTLLLGVAIGTVLPSLALNLGYLPWYLNRTLEIPPRVFALNAWVRLTLAVIPFALALYAVQRTWSADSLLVFFAQVTGLFPLVSGTVLLVGLTSAERARFSSAIGAARSRLRRCVAGE